MGAFSSGMTVTCTLIFIFIFTPNLPTIYVMVSIVRCFYLSFF